MMETSTNRATQTILTLLLVVVVAGLAFDSRFYTEALVDAFFSLALASVVILHLRVQPKWMDALFILAGTIFFAAVDFRVLHYSPKVMAWFSFLGLSSFLVIGIRTIWAAAEQRRTLLYAWIPALLFVMSEYFASTMLAWTAKAHPKTLDLYLLSFDFSLRVPVAFIAGQMYANHAWLHTASLIAYIGLAIPIALVYAGQLVRSREKAFPSMLAFLITGPLGILFYNFFPAGGPHNLLPRYFPFSPLPVTQVPRIILEAVEIGGARNAMPSLHMAWVLLAWWYSKGLSWLERGIVMLFVVLTAFSTMGTGEHWFVDLVVAFPFALMVQAICAYSLSWKNDYRVAAFFFGLLSTTAWLVMLRYGAKFFWTSPVVPWALVAATVALVCIRQAALNRAVDGIGCVKGEQKTPASTLVSPMSVPSNTVMTN
jgi:PAP2 superfamily